MKITRFTRACSRDTADDAGRCQMTVVQLFLSALTCAPGPLPCYCVTGRVGDGHAQKNGPGTAGRTRQRSLFRLSEGSRTGLIFWVRLGRRRRKHLSQRCSYRTGGWTNFGQNLDKCPIFVQGLSKVCPKLQNVLLLSNIFQISGQMSKFYISFVQDLSNFLPLSKHFWLQL